MLPSPHSFDPAALVGTTIDGRYRLLDHLASGGMGSVYRAEHVYMRKPVAVKLLRPELSAIADISERFRREAEIAASLEHENIVRVTDFGRSAEGWLFLVMDLLEGQSLFERLRDGMSLGPAESIRILAQVCAGLDAAHRRGVVHRDLKPENIFLARGGSAKIVDFGIAKLSDPAMSSQTQSGMVVGTPEYLSPEQAAGSAVDARADLYAVGLIAWRMLTGHHPLRAEDPRSLVLQQATQPIPSLVQARPELASWSGLVAAVDRACAKDPAARHGSASELRAQLEACLGDPGRADVAAPQPGLDAAASETALWSATRVGSTMEVLPAAHRRPRRRTAVALAAALLLALVLAGGIAGRRWLDERPVARAQALLATNEPEAARQIVVGALARHPLDPRLHVLHGRALHRAGQAAAALDAYAAALDIDPRALDEATLAEISADLADRRLADRSARVLARAGVMAVPAVLAATRTGPGAVRLRALELTQQLGGDDELDLVAGYGALLGDPDCTIRRAAVRRLSELASPDALPHLRELARQTRDVRGLFGFPQKVAACGASEADAAARKIANERDGPGRP